MCFKLVNMFQIANSILLKILLVIYGMFGLLHNFSRIAILCNLYASRRYRCSARPCCRIESVMYVCRYLGLSAAAPATAVRRGGWLAHCSGCSTSNLSVIFSAQWACWSSRSSCGRVGWGSYGPAARSCCFLRPRSLFRVCVCVCVCVRVSVHLSSL